MKHPFNRSLILLCLILLQRVEAQTPPDASFGRATPNGTVLGLMEAAGHGDLERAAEYLDSTLRPPDRQELARKLSAVLDRKLVTGVGQLSNRPDGDLQDGLPPNRDRVGVVEGAAGAVDILVERAQRGQAEPIWLFSAETLREIPRLYDDLQPLWIEQYLPEWLQTARLLSIPLYRWIAMALAIPLFFALGALGSRLLTASLRSLLRRLGWRPDERRTVAELRPLRLLILALFCYAASFFGLTLRVRNFWQGLAEVLTVISLCWLSLHLMDVVTGLALDRLHRSGRSGATALVRLIERLCKATAVILAGLVLLYFSGVDLTTVLAGLGVGGLAIGFGAQRTIENLFGGIMVISDRPVNVGDTCRAGDFFGTVEDIGIRSTRIRTLDRTVVSIPNGQLAMMSLENFAVRDRIWFHQTIRLTAQTSAGQLRMLLAGIRRLLEAHPKLDAMARTRFVQFSNWSLDVEIFAYVLVSDYAEFLAIQEELLIGIMDLIAANGTTLAFPLDMRSLTPPVSSTVSADP